MVLPDVSTLNYRDAVIGLAAYHRLPTIYPFRIFASDGGLIYKPADTKDMEAAPGVREGCAATASDPGMRSDHHHANSFRTAPSLHADMIFGRTSVA